MTHVKTLFRVAALVLATFFLAACDKGFEQEVELPEGTVAFRAIVDGGADTRTVMEEGENNRHDSKWYGEEAIQILGQNGSYKFTASISSPSSSATFTYAGANSGLTFDYFFDQNVEIHTFYAASKIMYPVLLISAIMI